MKPSRDEWEHMHADVDHQRAAHEWHQYQSGNINQNQIKMHEKGKVESIQANGTFQSKRGTTYYKYELTMNGKTAEYSDSRYPSINNLPFRVGDHIEAMYDTSFNAKFPKWNDVKLLNGQSIGTPNGADPNTWVKKDRAIAFQSSLKIALDFHAQHGYEAEGMEHRLAELIETAAALADAVTEYSNNI